MLRRPNGPQRDAPLHPAPDGPSTRRSPRRRPVLSTASKIRLGLTGALLLLVLLTLGSSALWVRWWWFGSVGYRGVLVDRALYTAVTFAVFAGLALAATLGNGVVALRRTRSAPTRGRLVRAAHRGLFLLLLATSVALALVVGVAAARRWETFALALRGEAFGRDDPVFGRDLGFFLFSLPALLSAWSLLTVTVVASLAVTVTVYAVRLGLNPRRLGDLQGAALRHAAGLAALLLALLSVRLLLSNYELAYSTRGVVVGASYTDLHAVRPANWVGAVALLVLAVSLVLARRVPRREVVFVAGVATLLLSLGVRAFLPLFVQEAIVDPDEFGKERPYIENAIAMTRAGFGLDTVATGEIGGTGEVGAAEVAADPTLLDNVRLWDYAVARETYQQLQTFAAYYAFLDVDVDRYVVDGRTVQVILAARELDQAGLPDNARTWTNLRLGYTHGYGVVVSPVDEVTRSGLPTYLVDQIPPTGPDALRVDRPEIYFGESDLGWVVVGSKVDEFTALDGLDQAISVAPSDLRGTIALDDRISRVIAALHLGDRNLLLSSNVTDRSALVLRRNIVDRVTTIAPFLQLDPDPYLVIADGRLVWVMDAYTTSDRFPHAQTEGGVNYVRASVKVTVDAATGETTFYRTAEPDPLADAWGRIHGDLFAPISQAPPSLAAHFRYPELLYELQSRAYATVHVDDARTFYDGGDRWAIPQALGRTEQAASGASGGASMPAYYMTLALPGETTPDFTLVRPFVPGGNSPRQTMTAWVAGRSDASGRLSLSAYVLPRQTGVLGPAQVEARFNQDPTISRDLTLWSQSGSEVIFGNLLVLPVGDTVLYVQPLYLRSTGGSGIPELTRVVVATRDEVVVGETLNAAVAQLTGSSEAAPAPPAGAGEPPPAEAAGTVGEAVVRANEAYDRGQAALAAGDWVAYGQAQDDLAAALDDLARLTGPATPAPAATPAP